MFYQEQNIHLEWIQVIRQAIAVINTALAIGRQKLPLLFFAYLDLGVAVVYSLLKTLLNLKQQ